MSDVILSTTESVTTVTVVDDVVQVAVTTNPVEVSSSTAGVQGATGAQGVGYNNVSSTSSVPVTLGLHTWTVANVGAFLPGMRVRAIHTDTPTIWVEGFCNVASGTTIIITADKISGSGTHNTWKFASAGEIGATGATGASGVISVTAPITNSGSASSAVLGLDQAALSITRSQVSDFTSGTVAQAGTATYAINSGTATFATTSGTATFATNSGTAVFATNAGTAVFSNTSGTATFATNASTAVNVSGSAITQSQVVNLTTDLAGKANLAGGNAFTGAQTVTIPGTSGTNAIALKSTTNSVSNLLNLRFESANNQAFDMGKNETSNQSGSFYLYTANALPLEFYNGGTKRLIIESTGNVNIGPTTGAGTAKLSVFNAVAGTVAQIIRGAASQTANLQEWQNSAGAVLTSVNASGDIQGPLTGFTFASFGATRSYVDNVALRVYSNNASAQGAVIRGAANQLEDLTEWQNSSATVLGGRNANAQIFTGSTAPIQTVVGGGTSGASGTGSVATISTTNAHNLANGDRVTIAGMTPTGYNGTYIISGVSTFSFNIANATTGSQTVAGTVSVDSQTSVTSRSAATTPLILRGAASQSSNLFEVQRADAGVAFRVRNNGNFGSGGLVTGTNAYINNDIIGNTIGLIIRGASGQSSDLFQAQTSAGAVRTYINSIGDMSTGSLGLGYATPYSGVSNSILGILTAGAANIGIAVRSSVSQTADLQQWQSSAGNVIARVEANGDITARVQRSTFAARFVTTDPSIAIQVNTGAASQTGDFFQTQTSTGTVMQRLLADGGANFAQGNATISSGGVIRAVQVNTISDLATIREANSGGFLRMTRQTASLTNPGANIGGLYFRDGTNAGTLKLVVRAGAAGAETTILDNIPQ
jgi:hypothetical protein